MAKIVTKAKQFHPQDKMLKVVEWVDKLKIKHGDLTKLELDIER